MNEMRKKPPLLRGVVFMNQSGRYQMRVFCPYCDRFHEHGWEKDCNVAYHRCAHCTTDGPSPFRETGYMIKPFSKTQRKELTQSEVVK